MNSEKTVRVQADEGMVIEVSRSGARIAAGVHEMSVIGGGPNGREAKRRSAWWVSQLMRGQAGSCDREVAKLQFRDSFESYNRFKV